MKKFLLTVFKVSLFQILIIGVLAAIKYFLKEYKIIEKIEWPYIWVLLCAGVLFVLAISIRGIVENQGHSMESWEAQPRTNFKRKFLVGLAKWGMVIPTAMAFILYLYIILPSSWLMAVFLYAAIVLRNCFEFFSKKEATENV
jgi:hypothetical protein